MLQDLLVFLVALDPLDLKVNQAHLDSLAALDLLVQLAQSAQLAWPDNLVNLDPPAYLAVLAQSDLKDPQDL